MQQTMSAAAALLTSVQGELIRKVWALAQVTVASKGDGYGDACCNSFALKCRCILERRIPPPSSHSPQRPSGFSGRRFCRIFPNDSRWILQIEHGGWSGEGSRKIFATLTAAIVYAVAHGLSYRVVHAAPEASVDARLNGGQKNPQEGY